MKADYDTEADAVQIDIVEASHWDGEEPVHDTYCHVALAGGKAVSVELLSPAEHLDLLEVAAARFDLDAEALTAAAKAALAAPNRAVTLNVAVRTAA